MTPPRRSRAVPVLGAVLAGGVATLVGLMARGRLTLDLRWGRTRHDLGPLTTTVAAPRELVFEQISGPYLGRVPAQMRDRLEVVERGEDLVVATHRTPVGFFTSETVEAVGFEPPARVRFRHLRGPVPHAVEEFVLDEVDDGVTAITYRGEIGLDLWGVGWLAARWVTRPVWEEEVAAALDRIRQGAERRAAARARRATRDGSNGSAGEGREASGAAGDASGGLSGGDA